MPKPSLTSHKTKEPTSVPKAKFSEPSTKGIYEVVALRLSFMDSRGHQVLRQEGEYITSSELPSAEYKERLLASKMVRKVEEGGPPTLKEPEVLPGPYGTRESLQPS